jgi:hypothetical protein
MISKQDWAQYFPYEKCRESQEQAINKILNSLKTWENLYIFKSNKDFDSTESKNIFYYSDILITDTSGSGVIGAFLNKKIIFM